MTAVQWVASFLLSLVVAMATFAAVFVFAAIQADAPGEDWLLAVWLAGTTWIPGLHAVAFLLWSGARLASGRRESPRPPMAIGFGALTGLAIALVTVFTDLL